MFENAAALLDKGTWRSGDKGLFQNELIMLSLLRCYLGNWVETEYCLNNPINHRGYCPGLNRVNNGDSDWDDPAAAVPALPD